MKKVVIVLTLVLLALSLGNTVFAEGPGEDALLVEDFSEASAESIWGDWSTFHAAIRVNNDEEFIKVGDGSLVITKASEYRQSNASLHNTHENWNLIVENNKIGFWLYVVDYENIYENEWAVFIATFDQEGNWLEPLANIRQSDLEPGWNWIETYIATVDESIGSLQFGFNHYAPEEGNVFTPVYIDSIYVW
ncbi:MAG: hypothetical protein ACOCRO_08910 [Halanaerobiales bacterium]